MSDFTEVKQEIAGIKKDIVDIKVNHLTSILAKIANVKGEIRNLRWFIMASLVVLGLVLGMLQVYG